MATVSALRLRVREALGQPHERAWMDEELDRRLDDAIAEFSSVAPRRLELTLPAIAETRMVGLEECDQLIAVEAVEHPIDLLPPAFVPWARLGDALILDGAAAPGLPCRVFWLGRHAVDENRSTLPAEAEDLVVSGAAALAALSPPGGFDPVAAARLAGQARARLTAFRQLLHEYRPAVEIGGRTYRRAPDVAEARSAYSACSSLRASGTRR